ncbi:hypothetical protein MRB53_021068 [Persea americana]|uniref:Uncharacterized protein n=1 Tax=Persea americana TaxID=3435 RepID=A0ACC2L2J8_PERAE|nr:hypothetical protein MRB53_021068 [Persea americana]
MDLRWGLLVVDGFAMEATAMVDGSGEICDGDFQSRRQSQVDVGSSSGENYQEKMMRIEMMKSNLFAAPRSHSPPRVAPPMSSKRRVFHVTNYGADPTAKKHSTDAILKAILAALDPTGMGHLMHGIQNLGGAEINLDGGTYLISRPSSGNRWR